MLNLFFGPGCVFGVLKTGRLIEVPGFLGHAQKNPSKNPSNNGIDLPLSSEQIIATSHK